MADAVAGSRIRTAPLGEGMAAWLLSLPAVAAYALLLLLPTIAVAAMSFTDFELGLPGFRFVGLANYEELLRDKGFAISIANTAKFVALVTPASIFAGLGLAMLIEAGTRGRAFFRAVYFLPVVSLVVAMATAWQYLLHPTIGPVNAMLRSVGIAGPNWLGSSDWAWCRSASSRSGRMPASIWFCSWRA